MGTRAVLVAGRRPVRAAARMRPSAQGELHPETAGADGRGRSLGRRVDLLALR